MLAIPQNTATAVERRIPFSLFDETDFVTPEDITVTGVKVDLSFGGAADAASTNDIVKVDGTRGMYYLELTQTEANNAHGPIHGYLKPTGCAACYIKAQIGPAGMYSDTVQLEDGGITEDKFGAGAITVTVAPALATAAALATVDTNVDTLVSRVTATVPTAAQISTQVNADAIAALDGLTASATALTIDGVAHTITRDATNKYITSITAD